MDVPTPPASTLLRPTCAAEPIAESDRHRIVGHAGGCAPSQVAALRADARESHAS